MVYFLSSIREVVGAVRKSSLQLLTWNSWHLSSESARLMKQPLSTFRPAPFSLGLIFEDERDSQIERDLETIFVQYFQFTQMRKLRQLNNLPS